MYRTPRNKQRNWLLTILYRLSKLPFASNKGKLKLFLDLEWIFDRLAYEKSFQIYSVEENPVRIYQKQAILPMIKEYSTVLDIGCRYGEVSDFIAEKAKRVVGIDKDSKSIQLAKSRNKKENVEFFNVEVFEYLTKNNMRFDIIVLMHIIGCFDDLEHLLMKLKDYCEYIYIEIPDFERSINSIYRKDMGIHLIYSDSIYVKEYTREDLNEIFTKCSFTTLSFDSRFGVLQYWLKVQ